MDNVKDFLSVVGAFLGVMTALVPLLARFFDWKNRAAKSDVKPIDVPAPEPQLVVGCPSCGARLRAQGAVIGQRVHCPSCKDEVLLGAKPPTPPRPLVEVEVEPVLSCLPAFASAEIERVRSLVKAPGIALVVAGFLGLAFNLVVAGYGYIDAFVTPLGTNESRQPAYAGTPVRTQAETYFAANQAQAVAERDRASTVLTIIMLLTFSVASAMAIWAGFDMIRLRGYWLSLAGCIAIMPGACLCCFAGMPVGIWSLTVLLRPEVRSAFS